MQRHFLLSALLLTVGILAHGQGVDSSHHVPEQKNLPPSWTAALWSREKKVYKGNELLTIGMPCGGIAAGQLYVRGDGTLANWWIANNAYNTGYGIDSLTRFNTALGPWKVCYQTFEPASYISQGFLLKVKQAGRERTMHLDKKDFDDISFTGEYPIAKICYATTKNPLPLKIEQEVFSPFIPMNARESATPGTILKYTVKNTSSQAVSVALEGWLQNMVCLEIGSEITADSRNRIIKGKGMQSLSMDIVRRRTIAYDTVTKRKYFPDMHPYFGNLSLSILSAGGFGDADYSGDNDTKRSDSAIKKTGDKLIGSVGTAFSLKPGESRQVTFLLTWFFPNRPSYYKGSDITDILPNDWNEALPTKNVTIIGNMYSNWFTGSGDVADYLKDNLTRLSEATHRFHDSYYNNSTLPYWLVQRTLMPLSILATETCQWWASNKFWAWEGVGSCVGTCTHVWNYEQALSRFFPELERNIRERTDFDISFQKDGSILARNGWGDVLLDGHMGAILKAYREYLNSKNEFFLTRNWDRIKRATEYAISEDGNDDGLIEKVQANTYDIAFYGANTYVGSLYLAALKAAAEMAHIMRDSVFAEKCSRIADAGAANTVKKLWNGEYFVQDVNLKEHPEFQYAKGCLSDQMFGQTWNHLNNLGYLYPAEDVKKTLKSIWKYNWAPDVGTQNKIHPPERTYASFGEPGLLVCTWPKSTHMGDKGVRYRDEVWTGIEYQVATNMIYENMIDEGLSIVQAVNERYSPEKHNPWNEIECGDHYARAMASWGVMLALEDYYYNGPQGIIKFDPKIQKNNFEGFFTAAEAWGNILQKQSASSQSNSVIVKYGVLDLKELQVGTAKKPAGVKVMVNGAESPATWNFSDDHLLKVNFDGITLHAGEAISLNIRY